MVEEENDRCHILANLPEMWRESKKRLQFTATSPTSIPLPV